MKELKSVDLTAPVIPNIAQFLKNCAEKYSGRKVFFQKDTNGKYTGIDWDNFYHDILTIASNLKKNGFEKGEKLVIFSRNNLDMLELELAVMAIGGIAVPIFAHFKKDTAELLITHSDAKYLAVEGTSQLNNIGTDLNLKSIWTFENKADERFKNLFCYSDLKQEVNTSDTSFVFDASSDEVCLNMYTSGTMGTPKCVQLMHKNILSQQAALSQVWQLGTEDRFLSYLPWHHSFGGIFELFSSLYNGSSYYLESGYGKDPKVIFENWKLVKPTVFFSVPKVYQSLVELTRESKEAENMFFNSGLKFIFTAAAALPEKLSLEFQKRNIPVIEGWGLTETSPCCTLTDPALPRISGVVGKPIPGVTVRIANDDEIQVKGPNVMKSYYKNDEANKDIFTADGWYRTGDVGTITESGLQLISRKDRIFKLSNGEKVIPTDLEKIIELKCHYVQYVIVCGSGREYPAALIFPNKKLLERPDYSLSPEDGCYCPRTLTELQKCLKGCLNDANCGIGQKFSKIKVAAIINDELSLDKKTLTPSMKVAPKNVIEVYKEHLNSMYGDRVPPEEDIYIIELDTKTQIKDKVV